MGEIADSIIDGEFDFITGEYLGWPTGYPRTRNKPRRDGNPKKGVSMWLTRNGIAKKDQYDLLVKYVNETNTHNVHANDTKYFLCVIASTSFSKFRKWVLNYKKINNEQ